MKPFCAYQNDFIKSYAVVMSVVIKRVDCNIYYVDVHELSVFVLILFHYIMFSYTSLKRKNV